MPGYQVKFETVSIAGTAYTLRSLQDHQQYSDPEGEAARAGISSAAWPLFGLLWPSARVLARAMHDYDLAGKRILEIGAGLALASLVIQRRDGDVTASDCHPLSPVFLRENARLNQLAPVKYQIGNWSAANPELGCFDLIIGSDVLYERQQPEQLARFIARHAAPDAEVLIVDPDRGNRSGFCRAMAALGYHCRMHPAANRLEDGASFKGRFLHFSRVAWPVAA